ncbi:hypothetical protein BK123_08725 [Paenibacillus lautus]|uniref:Uncharacterized protein n=1 Tax=Paenibacillus lautus TaxID=1401 RepID=A0A1R1B6G4_PAELA|nr:hypothetical protein BK123_08725 [Paenibacillus lautus]
MVMMMDHMMARWRTIWMKMGVMLMTVTMTMTMMIRLRFSLLSFLKVIVLLIHRISPFRLEIIHIMYTND